MPPRAEPVAPRPRLVPLSARKEERLRPYAERLLRFLERQAAPEHTGPRATLEQLAFTLQTRNEPMAARLALLAHSLEELRARLRGYLDGRPEPEHRFQGTARAEQRAGTVPVHGLDESALRQLAARWVEGAEPDWRALYPEGTPRRFPLPTYPFAGRSYWLPRSAPTRAPAPAERLHP
ncbi:MAG TPA: hypothetical protein VLQ93_10200, partial [Myxococcaceae bacterium]|nr:hypothetical protein [Myxococcaceae bacterium]